MILKKRLKKDRPMSSITIRMPEDLVGDLKRVAPTLCFSGYRPLIRFYIGQSLRKYLEFLDQTKLDKFITKLEEHGVSQQIIKEVVSDL